MTKFIVDLDMDGGEDEAGMEEFINEALNSTAISAHTMKMPDISLYAQVEVGCSDGNCILKPNQGTMHTNGGCACARELRRIPDIGFAAVQTINALRAQLRRLQDGT